MRYLLIVETDPGRQGSVADEERRVVTAACARFGREIVEPEELVSSIALADPSRTRTVAVTEGGSAVRDGHGGRAAMSVVACHLIECETVERAIELAAAVPDASSIAVEVRPVMHQAGMEM